MSAVGQTIREAFQAAVRHHQAGRAQQAAEIYEQILLEDPDHPGACHLPGVVHFTRGDLLNAPRSIERALSHCDTKAVYWNHHGALLKDIDRFPDGDGTADQRRIFVYDGNQIIMDFQRDGSSDPQIGHLEHRYLWGPAVDQILAEEEVDGGTDDMVQWTLTDHLNTVRDIAKYDPGTDTTTVVNHLVYDAFGNVTSETDPTVDSLFLYTARPLDPDTGLQNNLNRWYDASVGRWLSEDPIGFAAGDENLYRYVGNAPVEVIDPDGQQCVQSPIAPTLLNLTRPRASTGGLEVSVGTNPGTFDQKPTQILTCAQERTLGVLYDCCCGWGPWRKRFTTDFIIHQKRSAIVRTDSQSFMIIGVGVPLPGVPGGPGPGITIWWYQLAPGEQQMADTYCYGQDAVWGPRLPAIPALQPCP